MPVGYDNQPSASRRPASRHAANTARAYSGGGAGQATGRGDHHLLRRAGHGEAEPVPEQAYPVGDLGGGRRPAAAGGRVGTAPAKSAQPGVDRLAERVEVVAASARSSATAGAPASRISSSGTSGAQQCTTTGAPDRVDHGAQRPVTAPRSGPPGSVPSPLSVGTRPASTAGSDGSSSCSSTSRPAGAGAPRRRAAAAPRRANRPGRAPRPGRAAAARRSAGRCSAASVHGPAAWILSVPGVPVGLLGELVEVALQQVVRAAQVAAGAAGDAPAAGVELDRQVHQQRRRSVRSGRRPGRGRAARAGTAGRAAHPGRCAAPRRRRCPAASRCRWRRRPARARNGLPVTRRRLTG